jgi:hypothetical protein
VPVTALRAMPGTPIKKAGPFLTLPSIIDIICLKDSIYTVSSMNNLNLHNQWHHHHHYQYRLNKSFLGLRLL